MCFGGPQTACDLRTGPKRWKNKRRAQERVPCEDQAVSWLGCPDDVAVEPRNRSSSLDVQGCSVERGWDPSWDWTRVDPFD